MQESLFNIGIAGWGTIATHVHFPTLKKMKKVVIGAIAEPLKEKHNAIKKQVPGAVIYPDMHHLLQHKGLSAVLISLPSPLHASMALKCLEAKIPFYLEKPMATSLQEGEHLLQVWKQAQVMAMTGFNFRFHPGMIALKKIIHRLTVSHITARFTISEEPPAWKKDPNAGGALLDLASHHIDLLYFLFGTELRDVNIQTESKITYQDTVKIGLRIGKEIEFEGYYAFHESTQDQFNFETDRGKITFDRLRKAWPVTGRFLFPSIEQMRMQVSRKLNPGYDPSYSNALRYFIKSVNEKKAFDSIQPSIADGWNSLRTLLNNK